MFSNVVNGIIVICLICFQKIFLYKIIINIVYIDIIIIFIYRVFDIKKIGFFFIQFCVNIFGCYLNIDFLC